MRDIDFIFQLHQLQVDAKSHILIVIIMIIIITNLCLAHNMYSFTL